MESTSNKNRTLENVKLPSVNINGPHTKQNNDDFDMTYEITKAQ
jgi:hypothetical protein